MLAGSEWYASKADHVARHVLSDTCREKSTHSLLDSLQLLHHLTALDE